MGVSVQRVVAVEIPCVEAELQCVIEKVEVASRSEGVLHQSDPKADIREPAAELGVDLQLVLRLERIAQDRPGGGVREGRPLHAAPGIVHQLEKIEFVLAGLKLDGEVTLVFLGIELVLVPEADDGLEPFDTGDGVAQALQRRCDLIIGLLVREELPDRALALFKFFRDVV